MPQANVWQRCGCPARSHKEGACPVVAGFESALEWICMSCVAGCDLIIVPGYSYECPDPWVKSTMITHVIPGRVAVGSFSRRAGDSDREDGFSKLAKAFELGRLDLAEYDRRLNTIGDAVGLGEIQATLADLEG